MTTPTRLAVLLLLCSTPVAAQEAAVPTRDVAVAIDSGFLDNPTATATVVWSRDVTVPGVTAGQWLQLRFADTHLPTGSRLRIFAAETPAAVQWHDAHSIVDYRYWSCQFVGPTLRVELLAAPGSTANRTRVDLVKVLDLDGIVDTDTICGTTDDRVLSNDPRACRIGVGCSAWLFSEYAVGTAGHCMDSTAGKILHFNVPLSTASGTARPALPEDQYAMEAFHQFLNAGVGNDWSVSAAVRNSNTGLFPGQAQGSWYTVALPPSFSAAHQIRVTGYGSGNGSTGSPVGHFAQKSLAGPRLSTTNPTALRYGTDTTGGNSGSPVLLESTGQLIGVHTHGGCNTTGGGNSGTSTARADWVLARDQVLALHTVGTVTGFGAGCGSTWGIPSLTLAGIPEGGRTLLADIRNLDFFASTLGWIVIGVDASSWSGAPLPLDLGPAGMQGCTLYTSVDLTEAVFSTFGAVQRSYTLPADPSAIGVHVYWQYVGLEASAPNTLGVVASSAIDLVIGN
ncbi:MAG: serine protease [Planctomycetota bacterium]